MYDTLENDVPNCFFWFWQCGHHSVPYILIPASVRHCAKVSSSPSLYGLVSDFQHHASTSVESAIVIKRIFFIIKKIGINTYPLYRIIF
jgi:hypothetical protein